jgi:hypothetical protein
MASRGTFAWQRTLGLGLDEKAIEAVKNWRFEPATKDGKPVAVAINVEVISAVLIQGEAKV